MSIFLKSRTRSIFYTDNMFLQNKFDRQGVVFFNFGTRKRQEISFEYASGGTPQALPILKMNNKVIYYVFSLKAQRKVLN